MDVALCVVNYKERILHFSGARLPLFYSQNGEIKVIKGDKQSIGYKHSRRSDIHFDFTHHTLPVRKGVCFYMASDGFEDQMGPDEHGRKLRRLGRKRFAALLRENSGLPFKNQRDKLLEVFEVHRKGSDRQDDVTVMGFRFH